MSIVGRSGRAVREWEDDDIFSITGAVVGELRSLYPEAHLLEPSPVVQVVRGTSVDNLLAGINHNGLQDYLELDGAELQLGASDIQHYNHLSSALADGTITPVEKYLLADLCHKWAVRGRTEDLCLVEGEVLPDCPPEKFLDVWTGLEESFSLKLHSGKKLTRAMISSYLEMYEDGVLSEDGTAIRRGGKIHRLATLMGLPPVAEGLLPITREELETGPQTTGPAPFLGEPSAEVEKPPPEVTKEVDGVETGIKHVLKYLDVDYNSLPIAEKEIYAYGFPGAKAIIDTLNSKKRKELFRDLPIGTYRDVVVIGTVGAALKKVLRTYDLTPDQWAMMAGSRVLMQKGGWDISVSGTWVRRTGHL